jgi:hypothetical protein
VRDRAFQNGSHPIHQSGGRLTFAVRPIAAAGRQ